MADIVLVHTHLAVASGSSELLRYTAVEAHILAAELDIHILEVLELTFAEDNMAADCSQNTLRYSY